MTLDTAARRVVSAISSRLAGTVRDREPGHCLQVPHVPRVLADAAAEELTAVLAAPDVVRVVCRDPTRPWQATPSKVVELRNTIEDAGGRLVLFIPAGELLAAEDSFGASTFEIVEVADIHESLVKELVDAAGGISPAAGDTAQEIVRVARESGMDERSISDYLGRVVDAGSEAALGTELDAIGLLSDSGLVGSEDVPRRLRRNLRAMRSLVEPGPPAERVRRTTDEFGTGDGFEEAITVAIGDGTLDPKTVASRLKRFAETDFDRWREGAPAELGELAILDLVGDLTPGADRQMARARASVGVRFRCRPVAAQVDGLAELTLELMRIGDDDRDLIESGVSSTKRGRQLPRGQTSTWRLRVEAEDVDPGYYRFRLVARDTTGLAVKESLSPAFRIETDMPAPAPTVRISTSIPSASVSAMAGGAEELGPPTLRWTDGAADRRSLQVSWDTVADVWEIPFSRVLLRAERYSLDDPASLGRYSIRIGRQEVDEVVPGSDRAPREFLNARERAFEAIRSNQLPSEGDGPGAITSTADLAGARPAIEEYAEAWTHALTGATPDTASVLLSCDTLIVEDPDGGEVRLVSPLHPLRLLWRARHYTGLMAPGEWDLRTAAAVDGLMPTSVPFVVPGSHGLLRSAGPIGIDWMSYVRPEAPDVPATSARLAAWLGLGLVAQDPANPADAAARVSRYVASHPWVDAVVLNFIQPGAGDLILKILMRLQANPLTAERRYVVRLFASDLYNAEVGSALDEFMASPDSSRRWRNDAADALLAASEDPLVPRFSYSKHRLSELGADPAAFPAHITFLLDWFDLSVGPVDVWDGRSFYGSGLIVEPASRYIPGDSHGEPAWRTAVLASPESPDILERAYALASGRLSEYAGGDPRQTLGVSLVLDRVRRSVLDAVHRSSEWVVTVDAVFGDEYLDAPPRPGEPPRYLVEASEVLSVRPNRRVLVSSKSRAEAQALLTPVLNQYQLNATAERVGALLDSLQVLGAGLSLHLVGARSEAAEALGLALAALWLREQGVLRHALVLPLDLHPELFSAAPDSVPGMTQLRTDLAVIRIDTDTRTLNAHLVEVKARYGIGALPNDLSSHVNDQLQNSRDVLRSRLFATQLRQNPGSLAGAIRLRYLIASLLRYLERARRYGLIAGASAGPAADFLRSLDGGYGLTISLHGLLFDLKNDDSASYAADDVDFVKVGRSEVLTLLEAPRITQPTPPPQPASEFLRTVLGGQPGLMENVAPLPAAVQNEAPPEDSPGTDESAAAGPNPADVALLGAAPTGRQFGIIGRLPRPGTDIHVAFDLDGTNVVSVFGVQGSGKSYTLGTLLEAALSQDARLNLLPHPLSAVVFHYSSDETYVPEFASMGFPNTDAESVAALLRDYGTTPAALADVRVLVPPALLGERRAEFPGLDVHPLYLGSSELRLDDWKLLMGLEGGDQMYSKSMTALFRELRSRISLDALGSAIDSSSMSPSQKRLASSRLEFARPFVSDTGRAVDHLAPGRLVIVDLRDELIESDEALSLFMILLGSFGQATWEGRSYNKLIVFDEAHKYMANARLTGRIVETVREMRHRGTTVVLASQNPPSVPREVIELSTLIIAHRFTSPQWLEHIRKANADFADASLRPSQLTGLGAGEAYIWSAGSQIFRRPQLVRIRPRITRHGGATRRATG